MLWDQTNHLSQPPTPPEAVEVAENFTDKFKVNILLNSVFIRMDRGRYGNSDY